ncbi:MAG: YhdH/YhfP family quinone oxidoreductase [Bacteroidota bacterium]
MKSPPPRLPVRAFLVSEEQGGFRREVVRLDRERLPEGDLLLRVLYSSLNYKDALSATGHRGVTRVYPHVPGIDAAGIVAESRSDAFCVGDEVLVTGFELGSSHWGGFADYCRIPSAWAVMKPAGLTLRESMILGTAGFTAGLGVQRLLEGGLTRERGPVLVTGSTGGVGCLAVAILALLGFRVTAATRKTDAQDFLRSLGAEEVVATDSLADTTGRPLLGGRWGGVLDTVGGDILDAAIRRLLPFCPAACCGNILSQRLNTSLYPFILRGVSLQGINSAFTPPPLRNRIWQALAGPWKIPSLEGVAVETPLEDLEPYIRRILRGEIRGRVLIRVGVPS